MGKADPWERSPSQTHGTVADGNSKRKILAAIGEENRCFHTLLGGMWIGISLWEVVFLHNRYKS